MVSSGPTWVSSLGHCGVQFRLTGVWFPQDLLGFQLCGMCGVQFRLTGAWPLKTCWNFGFGTLWGSVQADRSLVSSGPAGDSGLGHCGDHFRLMGVWSPQDLQGIVPLKEKVSKIGEKVSVCVCCGVCLSSEDPGLSGLYVEGHGLSQFL